ncbi:bestrophin-like domain [Adhaeribacter soli]|uniref:DUF4239 domain-containing protein n=1 Tax=Adhaeribacter soli TaxID=2607655 RepID=A0A5N1IU51_9BACT|nr:DUF4239 domain-containing protein [Adhaeribacter soli]KAA9332626.1 DUF4239 domain-containing protein [Adhaeribacter soli]
MHLGNFLISLPGWALFLLVFCYALLATQIGAFFARRRLKQKSRDPEDSISDIAGAMLGLLAFLLGFTFSMTATRFGDRKNHILEEANTIGTTYLRTSYLPPRQRETSRNLLREYVDLRVKLTSPEELEKYMPRFNKILQALWLQTASLDKENMDSEIRSLYIQSVNETIDLNATRKTIVLIFRIPDPIWNCLFLLAFLSMFISGFQHHSKGTETRVGMPLLAGSFALVIVMIADMDSTGRGRLKVSQQPLLDVQQMMHEKTP